jgi:hypothetical protein
MAHFVKGENRGQLVMFPESIDDYIEEDSVVYFIDRFVSSLDISGVVSGTLCLGKWDAVLMIRAIC